MNLTAPRETAADYQSALRLPASLPLSIFILNLIIWAKFICTFGKLNLNSLSTHHLCLYFVILFNNTELTFRIGV